MGSCTRDGCMTDQVRYIQVRLDSDDVEDDQIKYLKGILKKHCAEAGPASQFGIRFQYDLNGNSHWLGQLFVLDIMDGACHLRLAKMSDTTSRNPRRKTFVFPEDRLHWHDLRKKIMQTAKDVSELIITLPQSVFQLDAEDLHAALKLFQVGDVMLI